MTGDNQYSRSLVVDGKCYASLKKCSEAFGVPYVLLRTRLNHNWTIEEAIGLVPKPHRNVIVARNRQLRLTGKDARQDKSERRKAVEEFESRTGTRTCSVCGETKELHFFSKHSGSKHARTRSCKQCKTRHSRQRRYGVTPEQYDAMLQSQNGRCAICGTTDPKTRTSGCHVKSSFCVDHCHKTGKVRGLLCMECNTGLGKFKDNPDTLTAAISYLNKPPAGD